MSRTAVQDPSAPPEAPKGGVRITPLRLSLGLGALVPVLACLSPFLGWTSDGMNIFALAEDAPGVAATIFWEVRLPRMLLGLTVGLALGLAGAALQGLTRNPLAEPGLLGASSGAAFGAVITFYFGLTAVSSLALPIGGVLGAFGALGLLFLLAGARPSVTTLILAGVAINAFAGALTSLALNLAPNPWAVSEIVFWTMGSLADRSLDHVFLATPLIALGCLCLAVTGRGLDALALGEDTAKTLGQDPERVKYLVIIGTGLAVGAAVSVTGVIGFVGLVVPHLIRPLIGYRPGASLLPSALAGAALLLTADLAVRLAGPLFDLKLGFSELKIGVLTALIGAPFFLWLLLRGRRELT